MEEVCEIGHKTLRKNFRGGRTFLGNETFLPISLCGKRPVMPTAEPDKLCNYLNICWCAK